MGTKAHLKQWLVAVLQEREGGECYQVQIATEVWERHGGELEASGNLLHAWQQELRWAPMKLRKEGRGRPDGETYRRVWALADRR